MAKKPQTPAPEPQDVTQTPALTPHEDAAMAQQDAQQTPAAPDDPVPPIEPPAPPVAPVPAEPLAAFIARHEDAAMALGIVVTLVSHPDADERVHAGRYGGIRLTSGNALATYSDGTQHQ